MISNNYIVVVDLESSSLDHLEGEIVQLAAVALDGHTLEEVANSRYETLIRPVNILSGTEEEIQEKWQKSWKAWQVNGQTRKALEKAPLPEHIWKSFTAYVKKYNKPGGGGKPILCGHNVEGFDVLWLDQMAVKYGGADKYGRNQLFNKRTVMDTLDICWLWFEHMPDGPESLSLDNLRKYFGISDENSHTALKDVLDTAEIFRRFLKIHRHYAKKVKFKGAFLQ